MRNVYVVSVVAKLIFIILAFINSVLINRYLGPTLRGEYAYIINIVNIFALILNLSIAQALPYFKKKYGDMVIKEFLNIIYLQLFFYATVFFIISIIISNTILTYVLLISLISQFFMQINFLSIISDINKRNKINVVSSCIQTLFLLLIYFFSSDPKLYLIIIVYSSYMIINVILMILLNGLLPTKKFKVNLGLFKKIIKYSFFPMITSLLITFNYNVDIVLLKFFTSYTEIGIYSLGVSLAGMLWVIPDAFKDVLFNKTAKNDSIRDIIFSIKINVYICIIVIIGFLIFGNVFIEILYGHEYTDAYTVTYILFIGTIPMIFFKMINTLYVAIGKQKYSFYILLSSVVLNVVLNIILIPEYSIMGAAFASVFSYLLCGMLLLFSFSKMYKININEFFFINKNDYMKISKIIKTKFKKYK
ncbi:O-antigen/teichoic acid export membrane protein [Rossellomorea marisflavi]